MILEISEATPSLNRFVWRHWSHYAKLKKRWVKLIWAARVQVHPAAPTPIENARVVIERYSKHELDTDNAVGGCKCVVDSLRSNNLIVDDDPQHLTLTVTQHVSNKPHTIIRLAPA